MIYKENHTPLQQCTASLSYSERETRIIMVMVKATNPLQRVLAATICALSKGEIKISCILLL